MCTGSGVRAGADKLMLKFLSVLPIPCGLRGCLTGKELNKHRFPTHTIHHPSSKFLASSLRREVLQLLLSSQPRSSISTCKPRRTGDHFSHSACECSHLPRAHAALPHSQAAPPLRRPLLGSVRPCTTGLHKDGKSFPKTPFGRKI